MSRAKPCCFPGASARSLSYQPALPFTRALVSDSVPPVGCSPPRSSVQGILQAKYCSGLSCPSPGEKRLAYNAGDLGSVPGSGRSPGEGNGTPLQHSCLENPTDRGAWWATVHGVAKSPTGLSDFTFTFLQGIVPIQASNIGLLHCSP